MTEVALRLEDQTLVNFGNMDFLGTANTWGNLFVFLRVFLIMKLICLLVVLYYKQIYLDEQN